MVAVVTDTTGVLLARFLMTLLLMPLLLLLLPHAQVDGEIEPPATAPRSGPVKTAAGVDDGEAPAKLDCGTAGAAAQPKPPQHLAASRAENVAAGGGGLPPAGLTEQRALLRNAMELAVMQQISHPTIMQVYDIFSNVTISRHLGADGSKRLSLRPAAAVEQGPGQ